MNDDWSFTASKRKQKYHDAPVSIHCNSMEKSDQYIIHTSLETHQTTGKSLHAERKQFMAFTW